MFAVAGLFAVVLLLGGFMLARAAVVCDCAFTSCGCVLLVCLVCVFEFDILTTFTDVLV